MVKANKKVVSFGVLAIVFAFIIVATVTLFTLKDDFLENFDDLTENDLF